MEQKLQKGERKNDRLKGYNTLQNFSRFGPFVLPFKWYSYSLFKSQISGWSIFGNYVWGPSNSQILFKEIIGEK